MTGGARLRALAGVVTRLGSGQPRPRDLPAEPGVAPSVSERLVPTRAIGILVDVLRGRQAPVVLDLGRVVGGNVGFLTSEFGCRLVVADLFADLDVRAAGGERSGDDDGAWVAARLGQDAESVDAVLCWDTLEYLTATESRVLASRLTRLLRPHGVLVLGFSNEWRVESGHATYEIVDRETLRRQFHPGPSRQSRVLTGREAMETFRELAVVDTFLLATRAYEMLFRKPSHSMNNRRTTASPVRREV